MKAPINKIKHPVNKKLSKISKIKSKRVLGPKNSFPFLLLTVISQQFKFNPAGISV